MSNIDIVYDSWPFFSNDDLLVCCSVVFVLDPKSAKKLMNDDL